MSESPSAISDRRPRPSEALFQRIAVHEASHAVARLVFDLDTITEISIDAPHGGYVVAETEVYEENTRSYFEAHLCMMLAGRAGEEEFLKSVGANLGDETSHSDHRSATKLAYDMETAMGFADDMPLLYRRQDDWGQHLARDLNLAARVNARLEQAYAMARQLVGKQSDAVIYLHDQLLFYGTVNGSELKKLLEVTRTLIKR